MDANDCEMYLADWYMCETCGGLYMAITESGYCVSLTKFENMKGLAKLINSGEA